MKRLSPWWVGLAMLASLTSAHADSQDTRHWIARVGVHPISPKPNNHPVFNVDDSHAISLGATYLFTKHWGLELFATLPAEYELNLASSGNVGSFDMLPLAATIQYHVSDTSGRIRAYVGAGVSYAAFGDERAKDTFAASRLQLGSSVGPAAAVGLDMNMGSRWFVNIDARWFDIDSDMKLGGANRGVLELDPYAFGLSIGRRLR